MSFFPHARSTCNSVALGKITDLGDLVLILRAAGGKPPLVSRSHFAHQYILTIPF